MDAAEPPAEPSDMSSGSSMTSTPDLLSSPKPERTSSPLSAAAASFIEPQPSDTTTAVLTSTSTVPLTSTADASTSLNAIDATPSTIADTSDTAAGVTAPAPQPGAATAPLAPHRRPRRRNAPPPKGILKAPTPPSTRFSFRRDILQSFNTRLAYATSLSANTGAAVAAAAAAANHSGEPRGGGTSPQRPAAAAAAVGNGVEVFKNVVTAAAGTGQGAAAAAGGFFGSAFKRFSNGVANVTVAPIIPQRDLSEDPPPHRDERYTPVVGLDGGASVVPHTLAADHPGSLSNDPKGTATHAGSAPHTPSRALAIAGKVATSPYATVHAPAHASALAAPPAPPPLSVGELKRVRFRMASLKVVYPINGPNGPIAPYEESKTRKRINSAHRELQQRKTAGGGDTRGWTGEELGRLYAECCRTREEEGIVRIQKAFRDNARTPPRILDLSNESLTHGAVEALSDVLSVDFGLKKLVLDGCGLDDESLRPLLHALLVSGSVPTVSLANNRRIRTKGWKYLAVFLRKAHFLRYVDLSDNNIDRKAADLIVQALTPHSMPTSAPPSPSIAEVDNSALEGTDKDDAPKSNGSSVDTRAVAEGAGSDEQSPKVEENRQEEDREAEEEEESQPMFTVAPLLKEDPTNRAGSVMSIRLENCGLKGAALEALAHGIRASTLKHISIRRNRIPPLGGVALAIMIRDYPVATDHSESASNSSVVIPAAITHSPNLFEGGNSVTARQALREPFAKRTPPLVTNMNDASNGLASTEPGYEPAAEGKSEATMKLRRQIEELPRTGSLLTLDVKGNDLRQGVSYLAQVLKRNRTLKVLNLSENKIDMQGLIAIADALKYNDTLETLDLSHNACCGPSLEGITSLRTAITVNSNLKRVFLNHTDLTSEGAIALSEFLPEAKSLIHLDLTGNHDIDIAGVLALSVSVKMNTTLRCLDLNIPPNDPDFARLSQEILQCCIRNTEQAQEEAASGGKKVTIAAPILKSAVARDLRERQEAQERQERRRLQQARSKDEILLAAEGVKDVLADMLAVDEVLAKSGVIVQPAEVVRDSLVQAQLAEAQLAEAVAATRPGDQKDRAVLLGDALSALLDRAKALYEPSTTPPTPPPKLQVGGAAGPSGIEDPSSPAFSLGDSDSEGDEPATVMGDDPTASPTVSRRSKLELPATQVEGADEDLAIVTGSSPRSPMESQSRSLTLEEGEIFRKGSALGTGQLDDEDDEKGDVSGEELKKEILEATVERSPRGSLSGQEERPIVVDPATNDAEA